MHVNQRVREAAADLIGDTGSFGAVYTNRSANLLDASLPIAVVGTGVDTVATETKDDPPDERRQITMTVTIVADGSSETLDDDLDALREGVEEALAGDLGGLADFVEHTGAELDMGTDEDGDRWFAFYALSWEVTVWTTQGDPEVST